MIPEQFTKTTELYNRYKEFMLTFPPDYYEELYNMDLENTIEDPLTGERWDILLSNTFTQEHTHLIKEKEYFIGCPFNVYQEDFHRRKRNFLTTNPDTLDIDFIVSEYENLALPIFNLTLPNVIKSMEYSITRTREFLNNEAAKTSYSIITTYDDTGRPIYSYDRKDLAEQAIEDYTDFSNHTSIEQVAYLKILGVLDFIKLKAPYGISEAKLASILSGFMGSEPPTIRRYLTGLYDKGSINDPLKNEDKNKAIRAKIEQLGLKLTD